MPQCELCSPQLSSCDYCDTMARPAAPVASTSSSHSGAGWCPSIPLLQAAEGAGFELSATDVRADRPDERLSGFRTSCSARLHHTRYRQHRETDVQLAGLSSILIMCVCS